MPPNILAIFHSVNGFAITLLEAIALLVLTFVAAKIAGQALKKSFARVSRNIKVDETQFIILRRIVIALIYVFGITIAISIIPGFGNAWISVLTGAGVLAVIIGFAAQKTFGNMVSGLFIALFRPFRVGDRVSIKGEFGTVEDITLVHTIIATGDNKRLVVPNSVVTDETVVNYSTGEEDVVRTIDVGIGYDSDIDKAKKIMLEEALKHPNVSRSKKQTDFLEKQEKAVVRVTELKDFSVNMRLFFWCQNYPTAMITGFELLESIKKRFDKEGIEMPYPYRTIVYKKDLKAKK